MDWKKVAPWNWFKEEEPSTTASQSTPGEMSRETFPGLSPEFERLFPALTGHRGGWSSQASPGRDRIASLLRPRMDISEGKKAYTVRAELAGVELEDLSIEVEGRTLAIRAEKRLENEEEDEGYHCIERSFGAVQRLLSLPADADGDHIDARFKNGVLKLRIPKHPERATQGRSIEIRGD